MSLVGPRPEDPAFVRDHWDSFEPILRVKPGMTGLCQLAFAKESQILDPDDRMRDYVQRLLPAKIRIDLLYASRRSVGLDVRIAGLDGRSGRAPARRRGQPADGRADDPSPSGRAGGDVRLSAASPAAVPTPYPTCMTGYAAAA